MNMKISVFFTCNGSFPVSESNCGVPLIYSEYSSLGQLVHDLRLHLLHLLCHVLLQVRPQVLSVVLLGILKLVLLLGQDQLLQQLQVHNFLLFIAIFVIFCGSPFAPVYKEGDVVDPLEGRREG